MRFASFIPLPLSIIHATFGVFLLLSAGCSHSEEKPEFEPFIGYWIQYYGEDRSDVFSLRKFSYDAFGRPYCTEVERGPQARIWSGPMKARWKDTCLAWDRLRARVSANNHFMQMTYTSPYGQVIPILLERTGNLEYIEILKKAEDAVGHRAFYQQPPETGDGIQTMNAVEAGLDTIKIRRLFKKINRGFFGDIHCILVMKEGKLIVEEYFRAKGSIGGPYIRRVYRDRIGEVASVTKSVTSALFGIAMHEGYIDSIDEPVFGLFPEYPDLQDKARAGIQIRHLLSMSSGLGWNENTLPIMNPRNDVQRMVEADDVLYYCLSKKMAHPPGETFTYSSGNSLILGEILHRKTGMTVDEMAKIFLFKPMGILDYHWSRIDSNFVNTAGALELRPRDLAKFGQMYLDGGRWNGHQVVPEAWVQTSTANHLSTLGPGYGYQWWRRVFKLEKKLLECYYAIGMNGKFIMVFPEQRLVFVSTAQNPEHRFAKLFYRMMEKYLLPAVL